MSCRKRQTPACVEDAAFWQRGRLRRSGPGNSSPRPAAALRHGGYFAVDAPRSNCESSSAASWCRIVRWVNPHETRMPYTDSVAFPRNSVRTVRARRFPCRLRGHQRDVPASPSATFSMNCCCDAKPARPHYNRRRRLRTSRAFDEARELPCAASCRALIAR